MVSHLCECEFCTFGIFQCEKWLKTLRPQNNWKCHVESIQIGNSFHCYVCDKTSLGKVNHKHHIASVHIEISHYLIFIHSLVVNEAGEVRREGK